MISMGRADKSATDKTDGTPGVRSRHTYRGQLPSIAWTSIALEVLLGIGALVGGGALVLSPDGHLLSMPVSLLKDSPFRDYLAPGLILFSVLGVLPLVAAALTWMRNAAAPLAAGAVGLALIIWIGTEMVMLLGWGSLAWTFYLLLGAALVGTGLWWWRSGSTATRP